MGLADRKQKQRIPADPRNLSWADDASRFGLTYLSKFGWEASQGLGSSGEGMKTHIKVQQKFDMMGIGAQHQRDPNGIAWKQNKDFEALLKRLNESAVQEEVADERVREVESATKKRRREDGEDSDARKKQKKEKRQKSAVDSPCKPSSKPCAEPIPKPRPMAHRARIRAAKRISGKSASAIAEILGIAPSSSVSPTPPPTPSFAAPVDNLTTSTVSVADYFKEKLVSSGFTTPREEVWLPRRGIGM